MTSINCTEYNCKRLGLKLKEPISNFNQLFISMSTHMEPTGSKLNPTVSSTVITKESQVKKKVRFHLQKGEVSQHFGHPLGIVSLIDEVQLQRHVLLCLLHQPHEGKVREKQVDRLQQHLQITN